MTYISSISAGVRRATSGRMNQAITTETKPVPAKLQHKSDVSILFTIPFVAEESKTYKKPVLTPQPALVKVPLIMSGVQKLNIMPMRLELARDQAAVLARSRCSAVSAA